MGSNSPVTGRSHYSCSGAEYAQIELLENVFLRSGSPCNGVLQKRGLVAIFLWALLQKLKGQEYSLDCQKKSFCD